MEDKKITISVTIRDDKNKTFYVMRNIHICDYYTELPILEQITRLYSFIESMPKGYNFDITIEVEEKKWKLYLVYIKMICSLTLN